MFLYNFQNLNTSKERHFLDTSIIYYKDCHTKEPNKYRILLQKVYTSKLNTIS